MQILRQTECCLEFTNVQFFISFFVHVKYATMHNKLVNVVGGMQIARSFSKFLKTNSHLQNQKNYICDLKKTGQVQCFNINLVKIYKNYWIGQPWPNYLF